MMEPLNELEAKIDKTLEEYISQLDGISLTYFESELRLIIDSLKSMNRIVYKQYYNAETGTLHINGHFRTHLLNFAKEIINRVFKVRGFFSGQITYVLTTGITRLNQIIAGTLLLNNGNISIDDYNAEIVDWVKMLCLDMTRILARYYFIKMSEAHYERYE